MMSMFTESGPLPACLPAFLKEFSWRTLVGNVTHIKSTLSWNVPQCFGDTYAASSSPKFYWDWQPVTIRTPRFSPDRSVPSRFHRRWPDGFTTEKASTQMNCIIHKCLTATQFNLEKKKEWFVTSYRASVWSWGISRRGWHPTILSPENSGPMETHTLCSCEQTHGLANFLP